MTTNRPTERGEQAGSHMDPWKTLWSFLETDPRDATCDQTFDLIHAYAEIVVRGGDPEALMPGVTAHLGHCPPCCEDFHGLLAAIRAGIDAP